ncbi:cysteinyl leukotriene receptor 2 [Alosa sapidissima]|uniref:cysteinyl leukotriene receptor 2 n=1 Tax=Alosa sapidissima TaxID=34773 RepID=UPI001C09C026|nr:cysteinyl leukotriene receptor 2 [Alosa sapidissima]XP_041946829.1 cysteinyl leukotriene receptor 2 [Alosa sapidissima]
MSVTFPPQSFGKPLHQTSSLLNTSGLPEQQTCSAGCNSDQNFKCMAYTVTYCIVFPIAFLCNSVALFVFLRLTRKYSANSVFMINLALSDTVFSLTLPFRLVYYFRDSEWDFPDWLCRICVFAFYMNLYTSVLFLTGLSVLRYIAIVHPLLNRSLVTVKRGVCVCVGIWVGVALLSSPFLMTGTLEREGKTRCFEPGAITSWYRILVLNYVALVLGFLLPFTTILGCYGSIMFKLVSRKKRPSRSRQNRQRAVYLVTVILSSLLLCFLPYHLLRSLHLHAVVHRWNCCITGWLLRMLVISLCLAASNSCLNPLMYYFAGESFRTTVRTTVRSTLRSTSFSSIGQSSWKSRRKRSQYPLSHIAEGLPEISLRPQD